MIKLLVRSVIISVLLYSCQSNGDQSTTSKSSTSELSQVEKLAFAEKLISENGNTDDSRAASIFRSRCAVCHGVKGDLGVNGAGDLSASGLPLEDRVAIIYYGKNTMTPFGNVLTDAEIVDVARYVEKLRR